MRVVWGILGGLCMALALLRFALPLLSTVPFLLLAALLFGYSSKRLHFWLTNRNTFGSMITAWTRSGAISLTAKRYATVSILTVFSLSLVLGVSATLLTLQALFLCCVLGFIWTRPHH